MSDTTTATQWLTQESYDRLKAELEELSGPGRAANAQKREAARAGGGVKGNGGYNAP
jgi:transcription elongation factor GreA